MKIAIFASAFHPSLGGVEELCRQLAHELVARGHEVIILTNRWPRNLPAYESFEGLPLHRLPFRMPEPMWKARLSYWLTAGGIKRRLFEILRAHRIEMLHVQCVSANAHYALEARRALKLPLVVTLQGELTMDATQLFQRSELARATLRRSLNEAEIVTACSARTLQDAEEFTGVHTGERGRAIFNAARTEDFARPAAASPPPPYLFALGRLVPQKGFDVLLRAFAKLRLREELWIAGEGPELAPLQALARELGIAARVKFTRRADRAQVVRYFGGCKFFVLPSKADEGLPVVCAEAMSAGKAIVATDSGGTAEAVLDEVNGLIVPKGDVDALAAAMNRMATDANFRQQAELESSRRAMLFRWQTVTTDYERSYRDALARQKLEAVPAEGALTRAAI